MPVRRLAVAYCAWIAVLAAVFVAARPLRMGVIILAGLTAVIAVAYGIRRHQPDRRWPWYLLALALLLSTIALVISRLLPGQPLTPYRPGTPALYGVVFVMSVLMIGGVVGLAGALPRDLTDAVDVTILMLGTGLFVGVLVAVPYALSPDLPAIQATARILFVARDVLLLAAIVHAATSNWRNASMALLTSGVVAFLTFDTLYRIRLIHGVVVHGSGIEVGWLLFVAA